MMRFGIGQPVPRTEDPKFLKGQGAYVDDYRFPNECHGYVLRSPHAHARIKSIDIAAAKTVPGVLAVLTGADVEAAGLGGIPCHVMPQAFGAPPTTKNIAHPILARDVVRHVGDTVAFVVAETLEQARDAAERIAVDYEVLPAAAVTSTAHDPGAPQVWPDMENNTWFEMRRGDAAATDAAFARADHVTKLTFYNNRISANAMEPRCSIAVYRSADDHTTLYMPSQGAHSLRHMLAEAVFHKPSNRFRVVCPDVGGGFGMKNAVFPENALTCWAAQLVGRPVRWTADRAESLTSDTHGRDMWCAAELALDEDGKILGMRVDSIHNQGAYLSEAAGVPVGFAPMHYPSVYDIGAMDIKVRAVFTHTPWTGPYRGAGRPEGIYVTERLVDAAARELGMDPGELRRKNLIAPDRMPFETPVMTVYDSGTFESAMDRCLELAGWAGFDARRRDSESRGLLRGRGLICFIEQAALFNERMEIRFDDNGEVAVVAGTHSHGQGHQTVYAQMVHEWLGVPFESVRLIQGDTDTVSFGRGTYGSRSMAIGGSSLKNAADTIIEKARAMAAHLLEAAESDIEFAEGTFTVAGTDKKIGLVDIARASHAPVGWPPQFGIGLEATGSFSPAGFTWPNGCHVAEVEVDPDTGHVALVHYTAVDDSGVVLNPLLFEGQIHGGVAQGIGQALCEDVRIDPESGQILSGSFMDYCMPRADDMPSFRLDAAGTPARANPLGVKGAGESGTVAATPAVMNAIVDALASKGVRDVPMPATPERVWRALNGAA